jgi:hypothetical protein
MKKNLKEKTCGESCACNIEQPNNQNPNQSKIPEQIIDLTTPAKTKEETQTKLDPTRFGDWELKGRAIDF